MSITEAYSQPYDWRAWPLILDTLPDLNGRFVLDLGCGIGDLTRDLSARGAYVLGVDINEDLVKYANERNIANARFRVADLRMFRDPSLIADGIWSSFTAAYFPALGETVSSWIDHLRPGGWIALTEIDDLFGHHPVSNRTAEILSQYVDAALTSARYDFRMGRKLAEVLRQAGLEMLHEFTVADAELSFSGPASSAVLEAWQTRFDRMVLLRDFCRSEFEQVQTDFLDCLRRDDHYCDASVRCCIARKCVVDG